MPQLEYVHRPRVPVVTASDSLPVIYRPHKTERAGLSLDLDSKSDLTLPSITSHKKTMATSSDLRLVVYESLEQRRAEKIGVKPMKNFDVTRSFRKYPGKAQTSSLPPVESSTFTPTLEPIQQTSQEAAIAGFTKNNTLAPFTTLAQKSTCGYYFNWDTINKKVRIGVPPSDLVKWRADYTQPNPKQ